MITQITYTTDRGSSVATLEGNEHRLEWNPWTGNVYLDDVIKPLVENLSEHLFHVVAADYFHTDRGEHDDTPPAHGPRGPFPLTAHGHGAGWGMACACGHYRTGWCPTARDAQQRMAGHLVATAIPKQRSATP
jgi:hypothetical protein